MRLRGALRLELNADFKLRDESLQVEDIRVVQALVAPGSSLIGHTLKELDFRNRYKALVLAMQRKGETINDKLSSVVLSLGDVLLVQAHQAEITELRRNADFIVLNEVPGAALRRKAPLVIGVLLLVVGPGRFQRVPDPGHRTARLRGSCW